MDPLTWWRSHSDQRLQRRLATVERLLYAAIPLLGKPRAGQEANALAADMDRWLAGEDPFDGPQRP